MRFTERSLGTNYTASPARTRAISRQRQGRAVGWLFGWFK